MIKEKIGMIIELVRVLVKGEKVCCYSTAYWESDDNNG